MERGVPVPRVGRGCTEDRTSPASLEEGLAFPMRMRAWSTFHASVSQSLKVGRCGSGTRAGVDLGGSGTYLVTSGK